MSIDVDDLESHQKINKHVLADTTDCIESKLYMDGSVQTKF
jgi:hypothetical protein